MKSVYIETTIPSLATSRPSLATSRPSRDIIIAGKQATTMAFWDDERYKYDLYISQYVIDECSLGDPIAAKRRLEFLKGIAVLPTTDGISELAEVYQNLLGIPERAKIDSLHLATCVIAEIDYMLSWNCVHLGIFTFVKIKEYNENNNLWTPVLLTPESLLEINEEDD